MRLLGLYSAVGSRNQAETKEELELMREERMKEIYDFLDD